LNESELSHRAAHDTLPLRDAFAVLFFVSVGMLFDPMVLIQQPLAVLATLAIIIFGKSVAAFFLVRMFGHSPRTALTIAASLAQIGEFAFILAGLGMALNLLPQAGQNLVLAGAISPLCSTRCCLPCWKNISIKPKRWKSRRWKRPSKKRSRSRSISATTRCWSALAASAACWARS
jgi:CPA2 family monovalent cation:H+ antiporter-2